MKTRTLMLWMELHETWVWLFCCATIGVAPAGFSLPVQHSRVLVSQLRCLFHLLLHAPSPRCLPNAEQSCVGRNRHNDNETRGRRHQYAEHRNAWHRGGKMKQCTAHRVCYLLPSDMPATWQPGPPMRGVGWRVCWDGCFCLESSTSCLKLGRKPFLSPISANGAALQLRIQIGNTRQCKSQTIQRTEPHCGRSPGLHCQHVAACSLPPLRHEPGGGGRRGGFRGWRADHGRRRAAV